MKKRCNSKQEDSSILVLKDEKGKKHRFEYLDTIEYKDTEYLYVMPADTDSSDILIMEIQPAGGDMEDYLPIGDDELLDTLFGLFKEKYKDLLTFAD